MTKEYPTADPRRCYDCGSLPGKDNANHHYNCMAPSAKRARRARRTEMTTTKMIGIRTAYTLEQAQRTIETLIPQLQDRIDELTAAAEELQEAIDHDDIIGIRTAIDRVKAA